MMNNQYPGDMRDIFNFEPTDKLSTSLAAHQNGYSPIPFSAFSDARHHGYHVVAFRPIQLQLTNVS
jgi:hypothetical protein